MWLTSVTEKRKGMSHDEHNCPSARQRVILCVMVSGCLLHSVTSKRQHRVHEEHLPDEVKAVALCHLLAVSGHPASVCIQAQHCKLKECFCIQDTWKLRFSCSEQRCTMQLPRCHHLNYRHRPCFVLHRFHLAHEAPEHIYFVLN